MDGTSKDSIVDGDLFRPASLAKVLDVYPNVVLAILNSATRISKTWGPEGVVTYTLSEPGKIETRFTLHKQDFERCVAVAKKLGVATPFRSNPHSETVARVRAYLKVEFADRS